MSIIDFPGKGAKSGHPVRCEYCKQVAVYKGSGMKNNFRRYLNLCIDHGPEAVKNWVVTHLDEFSEYKTWKAKQKAESKQHHPAASLFVVPDEE